MTVTLDCLIPSILYLSFSGVNFLGSKYICKESYVLALSHSLFKIVRRE